ncbi:MAG: HEAT-repeat-containing PBS lyase, partial [Elusimicrobia bacterium]
RLAPPPEAFPKPVGKAENLPAPVGAPSREEGDISAPALTEATSREGGGGSLDGRKALGRGDGALAAPAGPESRVDRDVTASADLEGDAGLKRLPDDPLPILLERLSAAEPAVRARAAQMLGARGLAAKGATKKLLAALKDPSPRVRSDAALALGGVTAGSDEAVPALKKLLRDPHPDVRYSAASALGRVGTEASERAFSAHLKNEARRVGRGGRR